MDGKRKKFSSRSKNERKAMTDIEIKKVARELHRLIKQDISTQITEIKSLVIKDMDEPMSVKTASIRYKLSESNIRQRIRSGELPYKRVGGKYILSREQLDSVFFK